MKKLTIGIVAEGPSDFLLLEQLINKLLEGEHDYERLHPEKKFGVRERGWQGVRAWCQMIAREFENLAIFLNGVTPRLDLLVIHLDADVAMAIDCESPCPPASDICDAIAQCIMTWLGHPVTSEPLVLCIPAQNTEAWILAADNPHTPSPYHNPPEKYLECVPQPDMIISSQGYKPHPLLKRRRKKENGRKVKKANKNPKDYTKLILKVLDNWEAVKLLCPQAAKFENDLKAGVEIDLI
jgi:hypothetical protein